MKIRSQAIETLQIRFAAVKDQRQIILDQKLAKKPKRLQSSIKLMQKSST